MLLADAVQKKLDELAGSPEASQARVLQIRVSVANLEPMRWLSEQVHEAKLFWGSRDDSFYSAAVGVADRIVAPKDSSLAVLKDHVRLKLDQATSEIKYYGGMQFDAGHAQDGNWASFGQYHFILPRIELQHSNGQSSLCWNLLLPQDASKKDQIVEEAKALNFSGKPLTGSCPLPVSRKDAPDAEQWEHVIKDALSMIRNGHALEKIVLARKVEFSFAEEFDKFLLFKLLREATPNCFHFYFQVQRDYAFLGAPPERLYRRKGRSIYSEAVAGTGRRDDINDLDIELGHALLLSDKDQREHAFVRRSIERVFYKICTSLKMDKTPSLMNLNMGRHLLSKFQGILRQSVSDIDILEQLPPTSAVGGHPQQAALETIRHLESFDRGWYAGPMGWMSRDAAEFAVAIRSGLASNQTLALYSGAGIVEGSEPDAEWGEIEQKLGDFIKALGLDQKSAKY